MEQIKGGESINGQPNLSSRWWQRWGFLLSNADTRANSIFDRQNSQVDEIEVGCSLGSYFDEPAIKFSSGESIVDGKNYGSTGTLSLIAKMRTKSGTRGGNFPSRGNT